jgi:hypothetical protein
MLEINLSLLAAIGIALAVMFFGYFFGLFEGRGQGYKRRKKEEEEGKVILQTPLPPPAPPAVDNSLLRLSLDNNNQMRLELDGKRVDTARLTADQRKRLIDLMVTMRPWIDAKPTAAPPSVPAAQTPPISKPAQTPPIAAPISQPKPTPIVAAPIHESKEDLPAPNSMVAQIDVILQKNLIGTPLAERGIRLIESPQGNVIVMVGLQRYSGVGEVTDPEVQAAIKAAIAEWERKYTPGV